MADRIIPLPITSLGEQITAACILEASARKPGNVHPEVAFDDLTYADFISAAELSGEELGKSTQPQIGQAVLSAIKQTRLRLGTNVNLGIVLLLAPLAAIPEDILLNDGIEYALEAIDLHQTALIYEAIQIASPSGMGEVKAEDVASTPTMRIVEAMKLAADRDLIARQYVTDFQDVLSFGRERFLRWDDKLKDWEKAIIGTHLDFMATYPDSLIARKCGEETANLSSLKAQAVLESNWPQGTGSRQRLEDFDQWLRADGHRRNPGTTADLIAAVLFSLIRDEMWSPPDAISVSA